MSITGRDNYITAMALAYAIAVMPHLPVEQQANSDRDDMLRLLRDKYPDKAEYFLNIAAETISHVEETYRTQETVIAKTRSSLTLQDAARLIANLYRKEADDHVITVGDWHPHPIDGKPIFHPTVRFTVGDFRRWAPDHIKE